MARLDLSVGVDIGSRTTKIAVLAGIEIVHAEIFDTTADPLPGIRERLARWEGVPVTATGYGRRRFGTDFPARTATEIKACAAGAAAVRPGCRLVLDVGGQDAKAILVGPGGAFDDFELNDRCSAGTGRFLEVMAGVLGFGLEEFWREADAAGEAVRVNSMCTVFSESEVVSLLAAGVDRRRLALGLHQANRFAITIREAEPAGLEETVAAVSRTCREGLPNYFGIQRFGVIRPITHTTGALILKEDFRGAVLQYIGRGFSGEPPEVREARDRFLETEDARTAIREFPLPLSYERSMLHHLAENEGDFRGALLVLPPKLLSLLVSGYQSWLFNHALSHRIGISGNIIEPVPGDRLLFPNGREDLVTPGNLESARVQIHRGRCRIAIRMPGCRRQEGQVFSDSAFMDEILEREGITPENFCRISDLVRTRFLGASRPAALSTDVESSIDGSDVKLSFSLYPGQYATTVCREYMKSDPLTMI